MEGCFDRWRYAGCFCFPISLPCCVRFGFGLVGSLVRSDYLLWWWVVMVVLGLWDGYMSAWILDVEMGRESDDE